MDLSPVVLFVYNRPDHTLKTLEALSKNDLADQSALFIYADGPKYNADDEQILRISEVRKVIRSKNWCKEVHIIESENNMGLANSIIAGVTQIIDIYSKIIVLEDDIVTSRGFLAYMNNALDFYESNCKVMHVSGYMFPHKQSLPETFFFDVPLCWGWATWIRAWKYFINDPKYLFDYYEKSGGWKRFNAFGGNYLKDQLLQNINGVLNTWFIKWHGSVLINNGLTLYPGKSLVENIGFDNSGIHNGSSEKFIGELAEEVTIRKIKIKSLAKAKKIVIQFYQGKDTLGKKSKRLLSHIFPKYLKSKIRKSFFNTIKLFLPEIKLLRNDLDWNFLSNSRITSNISSKSKIYTPHHFKDVSINDYTYISTNSWISNCSIGKYCSIGPNFLCGWGIHPVNGISTSPMFYSTGKQNGFTLSSTDKIEERKKIIIGNDVFIGANVTVLDGIEIGDGAVIGAGAVVSKNIPPYAIAAGAPIRILRYRFPEDQVSRLMRIKWWDFDEEKLRDVESLFFDIDKFLSKYDS
jgi:acetyltransferase-like isoleucine patch superfamily enzyme